MYIGNVIGKRLAHKDQSYTSPINLSIYIAVFVVAVYVLLLLLLFFLLWFIINFPTGKTNYITKGNSIHTSFSFCRGVLSGRRRMELGSVSSTGLESKNIKWQIKQIIKIYLNN